MNDLLTLITQVGLFFGGLLLVAIVGFLLVCIFCLFLPTEELGPEDEPRDYLSNS